MNVVPHSNGDSYRKGAPFRQLIDTITENHHAYLRHELPRLTLLMDVVKVAHAELNPDLHHMTTLVQSFNSTMFRHIRLEDHFLFPSLLSNVRLADEIGLSRSGDIIKLVEALSSGLKLASSDLETIRELTRDFDRPHHADNTYLVLVDSLKALHSNTVIHNQLEVDFLFPRVLQQCLPQESSTELFVADLIAIADQVTVPKNL